MQAAPLSLRTWLRCSRTPLSICRGMCVGTEGVTGRMLPDLAGGEGEKQSRSLSAARGGEGRAKRELGSLGEEERMRCSRRAWWQGCGLQLLQLRGSSSKFLGRTIVTQSHHHWDPGISLKASESCLVNRLHLNVSTALASKKPEITFSFPVYFNNWELYFLLLFSSLLFFPLATAFRLHQPPVGFKGRLWRP